MFPTSQAPGAFKTRCLLPEEEDRTRRPMISRSAQIAAVAAVVFAVALASVYVAYLAPSGNACSSLQCSGSGNSSGTNSAQGANSTYIATYSATPTAYTSTTSTSVSSQTGSSTNTYSVSTSTGPTGTYSYSPNPDIEVLSVSAVVSNGKSVTFAVQFRNTGTGTIYVEGGGGSSLDSSIISGGNVVAKLQQPRCLIATALISVAPGEDHASSTPGCWSGYYYALVQPGTVDVELTLSWSYGLSSTGSNSNPVVITAVFNLE